MILVVVRDNAAMKPARKTRASSGKERFINTPSIVDADLSFSLIGFCLADVWELRPRSTAAKPERPPTEARSFGALKRAIGPKMTRTFETLQTMTTIKTQAPNRDHHSRSSSSMRALKLETPTKKVAPN